MERPTKRQLESALAAADAAEREAAPLRSMLGGTHWPAALAAEVRVLAAEVRRLSDLADMNEYSAELLDAREDIGRLQAELKQAYDLANYPDAAEFRPDVVFARGFRQGRKEALAEFHAGHVDYDAENVAALVKAAAEFVRLCDESEEAGEWTEETDAARERLREHLKPFEGE